MKIDKIVFELNLITSETVNVSVHWKDGAHVDYPADDPFVQGLMKHTRDTRATVLFGKYHVRVAVYPEIEEETEIPF